MKIKILNDNCVPFKKHQFDAGWDVRANKDTIWRPGETINVGLGIAVQIPEGCVGYVFPRSSIGVKTPLRMSNSVGVIDCGYTGEIHACYTNMSDYSYEVKEGDRIAQLVVQKIELPGIEFVDELEETARGCGGFGSTGND